MKRFKGLYELAEVAAEIFENIGYQGREMVVYASEEDDLYEVGFRDVGRYGTPEHERSIVCTIVLSPAVWRYDLLESGIDPELIGTSDLDEELVEDYIESRVMHLIHDRMDQREEEIERKTQMYEELNMASFPHMSGLSNREEEQRYVY